MRVTDQVAEINSLARTVAALNGSVATAVNAGQQPNDLLDQRDQAVDRLARLTGATARAGANSSIDLSVGGSVLVAGVSTRELAAGPGGLSATFADGGALRAGGELGGYLGLISSDLPAFQAQLDQVADGLSTAVNAVQQGGYDYQGRPGGAFFVGTGARGITVDPSLTWDGVAAGQTPPAGSPPQPVLQDGSNALAMAALRSATVVAGPGGGAATTAADALRGVGGLLGSAAAEAQRADARGTATTAAADTQRAQVNGVSVDEEMVELVKYQHAYQAAARVISIADQMMQTVLDLVR